MGVGLGGCGRQDAGKGREREKSVPACVCFNMNFVCSILSPFVMASIPPPPFFFLFGYHLSAIKGELTFERVSYSSVFCLSMLISMSVAWFFGLV